MLTWELILFELKPVPDFLLQYAGVLGIMAIVLVLSRNVETSRRTAGFRYALVLGMSGFAISALLARYLPPPSAAPIRFDLLFLAGVIGGWRGGGAAFALIYGARVIFGNGALPIGAGIDMAIIVVGGILMHPWFSRTELADIKPRQVLIVWAGMVTALVTSALFTVWLTQLPSGTVPFALLPYKNAVGSTVRRVVMAPAALLFVSCLFAILRFEALDRRNRRIELIRMRVDPITQLPNRRALLNHVDALLKDPTIQHVTLLTITAQNYADMLLTRGHDWGDKFLLKLNQAIQSEPVHGMLRDFKPNVFLFTDLTLMLVLQKIEAREFDRRGLASALQQELTLTMGAHGPKGAMPLLSLCVAECDRSKHVTSEKALRDVSLHLLNLAPHAGNTVHYLQHNFADSAAHDAQVLARLTTWIDTHSPPLAYQPKCDLSSQKVLGAEALLRMVDNAGNAVPPQEVVALATRHQLLAAFEWCTLERVVQDAYTWMMAGNAKPLSVNISGASLVSADFGHRVRHLMDAHHLPRSAITLELTEVSHSTGHGVCPALRCYFCGRGRGDTGAKRYPGSHGHRPGAGLFVCRGTEH